jgi:ribosomal protein S14
MRTPILSKTFFLEKSQRKSFAKNEIFFSICSPFQESRFSPNLNYYFFKRRLNYVFFTKLKNRCIFSGHRSSFNSRLKMSRITFSRKLGFGLMPGFYRSVW